MFIGYSVHGEKITALKIAAHGEWPATWSGWMRSEWCTEISGGFQQFTVGVHWNGQAEKMKYMVIRQIVEVSKSAGRCFKAPRAGGGPARTSAST